MDTIDTRTRITAGIAAATLAAALAITGAVFASGAAGADGRVGAPGGSAHGAAFIAK